ncbi:MAG: aspartyl/asparaginyl beta-hydroxylase domain-containing protein [Caulobacteraceae bacterium]|nr:aspartyl/asparaginyl beta-hydroxylase domain-containing protein [Caulobacteraceae bacterium]
MRRQGRPWGRRIASKALEVGTLALLTLSKPVQDLMRSKSLLGDRTFFDRGSFRWIPFLEARWGVIRAELDEVLRYTDDIPNFQDISEENRVLTTDDRWKTFFFYGWGLKVAGNCERCPRTAELLQSIPGMKSAFFSILMPRKHIPAHRGPYTGVLRYHLGLRVPDPASCRIRVGADICHWREGESLIFDDTYEHEVWNDSDEIRVVLFVDVARPLPAGPAKINAAIIWLIARSSLARPALGRLRSWDLRLARVWSRA